MCTHRNETALFILNRYYHLSLSSISDQMRNSSTISFFLHSPGQSVLTQRSSPYHPSTFITIRFLFKKKKRWCRRRRSKKVHLLNIPHSVFFLMPISTIWLLNYDMCTYKWIDRNRFFLCFTYKHIYCTIKDYYLDKNICHLSNFLCMIVLWCHKIKKKLLFSIKSYCLDRWMDCLIN